jgi:hypothetical protein
MALVTFLAADPNAAAHTICSPRSPKRAMIRARPNPNIARVNCSPSMATKVKLEPQINTTYSTEHDGRPQPLEGALFARSVRSRHIAGSFGV